MAEYISKEAVSQKFLERGSGYIDMLTMKTMIDEIPAADVQPVKRGRWIITDDVEHFIAVCSECGRTEDSRGIKDMPYCHCGAKMDLEDGGTECHDTK